MSGRLAIVGLGPGDARLRTPAAEAALQAASDLVGYGPYLARLPVRAGQRRHASDNREELARARLALSLAAAGRQVAVVSSGDAGVFAMAGAVFEALDGETAWRDVAIEVIPGISALFAAAARLGAPLGHDFCALSLSDNLKPWHDVTRRLDAAARTGFVIALYNPVSRARPWQLDAAFAQLRAILPGDTPVAFATAISRPEERLVTVDLATADASAADMRTLVLVGSAMTRRIAGTPWLLTPRHGRDRAPPAAPTETDGPWLHLIGIGEDGALSAAARDRIIGASLVVGGARHLGLAHAAIRGEAMAWPTPLGDGVAAILARRGSPVVALASGDPFHFGVGSLLADQLGAGEMACLPAPSAFSLACARLHWPRQHTLTISFCGRPLAALIPLLHDGARILALSADRTTPASVAVLLARRGYGPSTLHVLEALGGPHERCRLAKAAEFALDGIADLNLVAIEVAAGPQARPVPLTPGLPDALFEHDGQLTKATVRAATLAALAPCRGELLWDVGCGAGSIGIEWMLADPSCRAIGIEARGDRAARARRNAEALGVPGLEVREGRAPSALAGLPAPHAVFLGGGAHDPALIEAAWTALRPGGRLVANAVTLETEAALIAAHGRFGGTLTRLAVARLEAVGGRRAFRPAMTVTQYAACRR